MIVFVDTNQSIVYCYDEQGVETFYFDEVDDLPSHIGNRKVLYVTNAIHANATQIVQTVNALIGQNTGQQDVSGFNFDSQDKQKQYLQSTQKGTLCIQDIDMTFFGRDDCKEIDDEVYEMINESTQLRSLMKKGTIRVIDHNTMLKETRKYQRQKVRHQEELQKQKDQDLDSIIVERSERGSAEQLASAAASAGDENEDSESQSLSQMKAAASSEEEATQDITDSILEEDNKLQHMSEEELNEAIRRGDFAP